MALDAYTSMVTAISSNWMHRSDLSTVTDDFIDLFESEFNSDMRVRQMEQSTSIVSTSGYLIHPTQWRQWKSLKLSANGRVYNLTPITEESQAINLGGDSGGNPTNYKVRGDKTYLYPAPSSAATVDAVYYEGVTSLSTSNNSNWLLAAYPGAYLFGSLNEASSYVADDPRVPLWKSKLIETLNKIRLDSERSERGSQVQVMKTDGEGY